MAPEQHAELVAELFKSALECSPAERRSFLDGRCDGQPHVRAEVESLLRVQERSGDFMEGAAVEIAAKDFAPIAAVAAGEVIGDYEIISLIGRGGMGEVYLAQDRRLLRRAALKLVRSGMDSEAVVRRFQREQRLLASFNHPGIAQLYEAAVTPKGIPFFAMEYVDGIRIDHYCRDQALSIASRLELFIKVCAAIQYAHQHLVVHRDIKPSNVLVTAEGQPKLLDFGIAKLLDALSDQSGDMTMTLDNVMTPEYASPEHVRGEPVTTTSDVYSLGILLYELLTETKPYKIENFTPIEIARVISEREPDWPSTALFRTAEHSLFDIRHSKFLKGDVDNIVLMALRKEPERRYQSVAQFADDIRRHLAGFPVIARGDNMRYRAGKFLRRHRYWLSAAALLIGTLVAGVVVTTRQARIATREKHKAERISTFLERMLSFSNQSVTSISPVAHGPDVTVNQMLDEIRPQVERELADEPEVRARVLRTIGSAYASRGQYESAEQLFRVALPIQKVAGVTSEAARTMSDLGVLWYREGKFQEAADMLGEAISFYRDQQRRRASDFRPAQLALVLDYHACATLYLAKFEPAIAEFREALQLSSTAKLSPEEKWVISFNKSDLGGALATLGRVEEAEKLLREAVVELRQLPGLPRWELGNTLTLLGVTVRSRRELDEALQYLHEGEEILRRALGNANLYLATNLGEQGSILSEQGKVDLAEDRCRSALRIAASVSPKVPTTEAWCLWRLGQVLTQNSQAAEAERCLRKALELYQHSNLRTAIPMVEISLSKSLSGQQKWQEAEAIAADACALLKEAYGDDHALTKSASAHLAALKKQSPRP
jgi:serine/threonine protein kinase/tetratricopeptide (TPR) repeat protein